MAAKKQAKLTGLPNIVIASYDDWEGIYADGKLKYQSHGITYHDVLDVLNIPYESLSVEDMEKIGSSFPKNLDELKKRMGEC